jgi:hypothetical protein
MTRGNAFAIFFAATSFLVVPSGRRASRAEATILGVVFEFDRSIDEGRRRGGGRRPLRDAAALVGTQTSSLVAFRFDMPRRIISTPSVISQTPAFSGHLLCCSVLSVQ